MPQQRCILSTDPGRSPRRPTPTSPSVMQASHNRRGPPTPRPTTIVEPAARRRASSVLGGRRRGNRRDRRAARHGRPWGDDAAPATTIGPDRLHHRHHRLDPRAGTTVTTATADGAPVGVTAEYFATRMDAAELGERDPNSGQPACSSPRRSTPADRGAGARSNTHVVAADVAADEPVCFVVANVIIDADEPVTAEVNRSAGTVPSPRCRRRRSRHVNVSASRAAERVDPGADPSGPRLVTPTHVDEAVPSPPGCWASSSGPWPCHRARRSPAGRCGQGLGSVARLGDDLLDGPAIRVIAAEPMRRSHTSCHAPITRSPAESGAADVS